MSRQALTVWVLLALALTLIALAVFLRPGEGASGGAEALRRPILAIDPARVESIRVTTPGAREALALERSEGAIWLLTTEPLDDTDPASPTPRPWPLEPVRVRALLTTLSNERPAALAGAGSTLPTSTINVEFHASGGVGSLLRIDPTAVGGRVVAQVDDGPLVLTHESLAAVFTQPGPLGWRDTKALQTGGLEPSRITIGARDGELTLLRAGGTWVARSSDRVVRADPAAVRSLLGALSGISVERFVDEGRPEHIAYGLAEPRLRVSAEADRRTSGPGGEVQLSTDRRELLIGGPASLSGDLVFATSGDGRTVFSVKAQPLRALTADLLALAARTASAQPPANVGMLIITAPKGQVGFRREQVGWSALTDAAPRPVPDPAPIDEVLALVSERIGTTVALAAPTGWRAEGTIALMDFAGDPLEQLEYGRLPDGALALRSFDGAGDAQGVWRIYSGDAGAPGLLGLNASN